MARCFYSLLYVGVVAFGTYLVLAFTGSTHHLAYPEFRWGRKSPPPQSLPQELRPQDEHGRVYRMIRIGEQYVYVD